MDNQLENTLLSQPTLKALHGLDDLYQHILANHNNLSATDLIRRVNAIKAGMLESVEQIARDNGA